MVAVEFAYVTEKGSHQRRQRLRCLEGKIPDPQHFDRAADAAVTTPHGLFHLENRSNLSARGTGSNQQLTLDRRTFAHLPTPKENSVNTQSYSVTGMTCGHCASAVARELAALTGVANVKVDLVAGGTSTVTITSDQPLASTVVATALDEAGDYQLA